MVFLRGIGRLFLLVVTGIVAIVVGSFMLRGNMHMWDGEADDGAGRATGSDDSGRCAGDSTGADETGGDNHGGGHGKGDCNDNNDNRNDVRADGTC